MEKLFYPDLKLGVLGGGQLGRMLIQAAIDYNLEVHILDPDTQAPCRGLAHSFHHGPLVDYDAVMAFGKDLDLLTIEIENVNADALEALQNQGKQVFPDPQVIKLIQDKRSQKLFFRDYDIPTAPFELVETQSEIWKHAGRLPLVLKMAREGYDGRGVMVLRSKDQIDQAFDGPAVLEDFVDLDKEIAVIVARSPSGEIKVFPAVEMSFHPEANLVEFLFSPANLTDGQMESAFHLAERIAKELNYVGVLAIEMFLTRQGELLVNELAPRPHNSGHHTIRANETSQYEQHLRAILDLPLGSTRIMSPAAMVNLLGEPGHTGPVRYQGIEEVLKLEGVYPHFYGKSLTKPFRKMGHVTILDQDVMRLQEKARLVKQILKVVT